MRWLYPRKLYHQIAVLISVVVVAVFFTFGSLTAKRQTERLRSIMTESAMRMSQGLAESCIRYLIISDYAGLDELLEKFIAMSETLRIQVYRGDGKVLSEVSKESATSPPVRSVNKMTAQVPDGATARVAVSSDRMIISQPVVSMKVLGWVSITYSMQNISDMRRDIWIATGKAALFWTFLSISFFMLFFHRLARAIQNLSDFARQLGSRKGEQIDIRQSSYEIQQLCQSLNYASVDLNSQEQELSSYRDHLETLIAKRTAELQEEIAERKKIEEVLKESETRYRLLAENATDLIWTVDMDMRLTYVSPSVTRLLGFTVEEAMARTMRQVYTSAAFEKAMQSLTTEIAVESAGSSDPTRSQMLELELVRKDGNTVPVEGNFCFLRDSTDKALGFLSIVRDITERKRAETQRMEMERRILESRKVESLGRMAGAIAHHFNNLLAVVMGNLELAMDELPPHATASDCVSEAMAASRRAADLSRLMLTYVGQDVHEKTLCDLSEEVLRSLPLIEATLPGKVLLEKSIGSGLPLIRVDTDALRQVVVNLAINAWESLSDAGGIVCIRTGTGFFDEAAMRRVVGMEPPLPGNYVFLEVRDEGCGMDAETLARMCDPFFSTKFTGRGLGLATVMGIIRSHRGGILVDSMAGKGTTVRVLLPATGDPKSPVEHESDTAPSDTQCATSRSLGALTVLLAEDEEMVLHMAQIMLQRLGYTVIPARDGAEALEMFGQHKDRIHCVLLDMTMPRLNGWEVLQSIRQIRADVPVIFASGYDEAQVLQGNHPERPQAFIHKPYALSALKAALANWVS